MTSNRLDYIDVAKGLGILTVVAGHIFAPSHIVSILYLFHMPLFFFISGFLFIPKADQTTFFKVKIMQLLPPYILFLFIMVCYQTISHAQLSGSIDFKAFIGLIWRAIFGGRWLYGWGAVFWFISVLMLLLVFMNFIILNVNKKVIGVIMLLLLALSYINAKYFQSLKIPFNANVLLAAAPIFYVGFRLKDHKIANYSFLYFCVFIVACILIYTDYLPSFDMKSAKYGIPFISFIFTICSVLVVLSISRMIVLWLPLLTRLLSSIGKASIVLMYIHQPVQILASNVTDLTFLKFTLAISVPYIIYVYADKWSISRLLIIGSARDCQSILEKFK